LHILAGGRAIHEITACHLLSARAFDRSRWQKVGLMGALTRLGRSSHLTVRGAPASVPDKNIAGIQANTFEGAPSTN
jgi:hypothetical protein